MLLTHIGSSAYDAYFEDLRKKCQGPMMHVAQLRKTL